MWVNIAQFAVRTTAQLRQQASDRQIASSSSSSGQQQPERQRVPPQREQATILRGGRVGKEVAVNQQHEDEARYEQLEMCAGCGAERHVLTMCHRCTRFYCRDGHPPCVDMVAVWQLLPQTPPQPSRWTESVRLTCRYCKQLVQLMNPGDPGETRTVLDTESDWESDSNSFNSQNNPVV